jgi:anti-sigma B factor antagonist
MSDQAAQVTPVVVELPPEIDVTNSEEVYEELVGVLAPGVEVLVGNLTGTEFCDSSGMHAIMHAQETAAARNVEMRLAVSTSGSVRRVLQLMGIAHLMPVYESLAEAVQPK